MDRFYIFGSKIAPKLRVIRPAFNVLFSKLYSWIIYSTIQTRMHVLKSDIEIVRQEINSHIHKFLTTTYVKIQNNCQFYHIFKYVITKQEWIHQYIGLVSKYSCHWLKFTAIHSCIKLLYDIDSNNFLIQAFMIMRMKLRSHGAIFLASTNISKY